MYAAADPSITMVTWPRPPDSNETEQPDDASRGYRRIAHHFRLALHHVLSVLGYEAVIIVEDDLEVAPDFFEYFQGTYPLLVKDPSLWCISAWNDNGNKSLIDVLRPELLHRTDFFPGLGWMLRRESWLEFEPNWPETLFDTWLRKHENVGYRSCIRPEISRTHTFGKEGVSNGLYFDSYLRHIYLNTDYVEFTKLDLSYLLKEQYDSALSLRLARLDTMSCEEVTTAGSYMSDARVLYSDAQSFLHSAKKMGLMQDLQNGMPRTAYEGIVTCYMHGRRIYLTPSFKHTEYDPNWEYTVFEDSG